MALACDAHALTEFPPYDAISISHKTLLLPVQNMDQKKKIARYKTKMERYQEALNDIQQALEENSYLPPPNFQ